ncbi:MAG: hypothetical protein AAFW95_05835 [Cyanobacteria bacterium J06638_6]
MLFYLHVPKSRKKEDPPPPQSGGTESAEQHALTRYHQAEANKVYQKAREDYLCERRFIL